LRNGIGIKKNRHLARDSRQAILPVALRVNANPFQTDLCQDPEATDGNIHIQLTVFCHMKPFFEMFFTSLCSGFRQSLPE
jgi:hypothetical protein